MTELLRVAILSDIHAGEVGHGDTFVVTEPPASRPNENPLRDLATFIESSDISADLLLCPGDLGNRAHAAGRIYGWSMLQEVGDALHVQDTIATVGNHDVETRSATPDQAQLLKLLVPRYPVADTALSDAYWRDGFYIDDTHPQFRILNINSCADFPPFPGISATDAVVAAHKLQVERGAISLPRLAMIESALAGLSPKPANIALMHHHPVEHARRDLFKDTYGPAENGESLLAILESAVNCGRWLLVHGHKHIPNFTVDGGSANSPMVLCAASVGGHLWQPIASVARNQFHVVEFEIDRQLGLPISRGSVKSWAWSLGEGWTDAPPTTGLPATFGFGALNDPNDLADQAAALFTSASIEFLRWDNVLDAIPFIRYLGPADFKIFEDRLATISLALERRRNLVISNIAREATWS